jgi:uncharacterized protein YsxB (DUF464 family)
MTSVTLYTRSGELCGFASEGHSGYADSGNDIVCAGISALTAACVNSLESVAGIVPKVVQRPKDAYLQALLPEGLSKEQQHDAQVILKSLRQGIGDLTEQYPKFVRLSIEEWRKPK